MILYLYILYLYFNNFLGEALERVKNIGRRWWVREFNYEEARENWGAFNMVFIYFKHNDTEQFYKFVRMTPSQFEYLHFLVGDRLTKHSFRTPIPSQLRLAMTLHFLAHGDAVFTLAKFFRLGVSTVYEIIPETCSALFDALRDLYLILPEGEEWIEIANEFERLWNFPNCIGAIDTRQFEIVKPPNSGSLFYHYSKRFTMGAMCICDAHMRFLWSNVGSYGSPNDSGVFFNGDLRRAIINGVLQFPRKIIRGTGITRLFFLGDAGFGLESYLLVPFSRLRHLLPEMRLFNYRQSRARRIIECAFGLLVIKWQAFKKPLGFNVRNCEISIMAALCLHNYLITLEMNEPEENQRYLMNPDHINVENQPPQQVPDQNNDDISGQALRNALLVYFQGIGEIPWQYERI